MVGIKQRNGVNGIVSVNNTLFVMKNGNDTTAKVGRFDLPYLTIQAAVTAAGDTDLIIVYPGTYNEAVIMDVTAANKTVNLYMYPDAEHVYSGAAANTDCWAINGGLVATLNIYGHGVFKNNGTTSGNVFDVISNLNIYGAEELSSTIGIVINGPTVFYIANVELIKSTASKVVNSNTSNNTIENCGEINSTAGITIDTINGTNNIYRNIRKVVSTGGNAWICSNGQTFENIGLISASTAAVIVSKTNNIPIILLRNVTLLSLLNAANGHCIGYNSAKDTDILKTQPLKLQGVVFECTHANASPFANVLTGLMFVKIYGSVVSSNNVPAVLKQIIRFIPANVEIGDTFTITYTPTGHAVSFVATAANVANVTAGLTAAWNASVLGSMVKYTAVDNGTDMEITNDLIDDYLNIVSFIATAVNGGAADTQTLTKSTTQAADGVINLITGTGLIVDVDVEK
jgi:hypothetical protein